MSLSQANSETLNRFVHSSVNLVVRYYSLILATLMVIFSIEELHDCFTNEFFTPDWHEVAGYLFLFFGGLVILVDRQRNLLRSVGIYALALGGYRFINSVHTIHPGPYGLFSLVIAVLGINLMISGRFYLHGVSRNRVSLMFSTLTLLISYLLVYVFMMHMGLSFHDCVELMPGQAIMCVMYAFYIGILDSEVLRASDILAIHNETLNKIRCTQYTDPETWISQDVADVLSKAFTDRSDWTPISDGGPAVSEFRFDMKNKDGKSEVLVQNWKDSDELYFTISDHLDGTLIQAYRFAATSSIIVTDELCHKWLRVFGRQGICLQLRVDDPVEMEVDA